MALGDSIEVVGSPTRGFEAVTLYSMTSAWQTIIDAGGPAVQDAATITNPTTQIVASTAHLFQRRAKGTNLILRLGYDDALTSITDPIVKVFGRTGSTDVWQILKTKSGSITCTLSTAPTTDTTDGTLRYTTPDSSTTTFDCFGTEEILVGIQTALAGTGTTNNSIIQAKFI